MGIILTKGTSRKYKDNLEGKVQVKNTQLYILVVQSLCIQNFIYIGQNTELYNLNLSFERFVMLVYSFS